MFWLLVVVWIINLFDLGFTLLAHQQGLLTEMNPLAAQVLPYGPAAVAAYKLTLLGLGTALLWPGRRLPLAEHGTWLYVVVCLMLAVHWHQLYRDTDLPHFISRRPAIVATPETAASLALSDPRPPDASRRAG